MIKSFLIESINDVESINENVQSTSEDVQLSDQLFAIISLFAITKFVRARRLSLRYQNWTDIIVFLQNDDSFSNQFEEILLSI